MPAPRHLLYLHSHDTGRYIRPYGHELSTPHLQAFAQRGVLFRHGFCNNPTCSPSRACLLTGQYAHTNGMMGLVHRGGRLHDPSHTLPAFLRDRGFDTVLAGLQHIAPHELDDFSDYGYTHEPHRDRPPTNSNAELDRVTAQAAADFLKNRCGSDPPFFLDVGFFTTHRTSVPDDPHPPDNPDTWHNGNDSPMGDPRYVDPPAILPDTASTRQDYADYAESVRRLDAYHGTVLDALDAAGLRDQTLVVITTDHGIAFPGMKCSLTAHGTGVLWLMAGPGGGGGEHERGDFTGGRVLEGLASHVDLFPTICEAFGFDAPDRLQGTSLMPLVRAERDDVSVRDEVFAEVNYHAAFEPKRCVRTARYSYHRRLQPMPHTVRPNMDDGITKRKLEQTGAFDASPPTEALYDLHRDPQEVENRIDDPAYADVLRDLRQRLDRWMADTDDPGRDGPPRVPGMGCAPIDANRPDGDGRLFHEPADAEGPQPIAGFGEGS
jgi:arylsulfatase A-like enzyme